MPSTLRVAVVGSGPSGVYTAQSLLQARAGADVLVDIYDRLPCPYGLVRYGVAPDHEKIKSLQRNLREVLEHPGVRFVGNVAVGEPGGVTPAQLRALYHAVVYCVGAAADRRLGIPGEDLPGSCSATEFVAWYSAHPDAAARRFPLGSRSVVVIGAGNVALDVVRMLLRTPSELTATDIPQGPLDALTAGRADSVHLVARRGPSQTRFTTKELRELDTLTDAVPVVRRAEVERDPHLADPSGLAPAARRNLAVLSGWSGRGDADPRVRRIALRFHLRPVEVLGDAREGIRGVRFERTVPDGPRGVRGSGEFEDIGAGLVLRSVGYRGVPLPGLPFDDETGTVPHEAGRVVREGAASVGEYVAGWIKRGPSGVIGTNRHCARDTVASLLADRAELAARPLPTGDPLEVLRAAGHALVEWDGWLGIERAEAEHGRRLGRGTVKLPDRASLLEAATALREVV